jgi:hypothetical protein
MGKPFESLASFDQALLIHRKMAAGAAPTPVDRPYLASTLRLRGIALQRCGKIPEASSSFRDSIAVLRGQSAAESMDYYNIACAQSLLSGLAAQSGSGLTAVESRAEADHAMQSLRLAAAAGWRDSSWAAADPDLAPIRSRADFQSLILDIGFPADPFER